MTDEMTEIRPRSRPRKRGAQPPDKKQLPVTKWTVEDDRKLTVLIGYNPKSPMSPAAKRFELYRKAETVGQYRKWMKQGKCGGKPHFANLDLFRDRERGYIKF